MVVFLRFCKLACKGKKKGMGATTVKEENKKSHLFGSSFDAPFFRGLVASRRSSA